MEQPYFAKWEPSMGAKTWILYDLRFLSFFSFRPSLIVLDFQRHQPG